MKHLGFKIESGVKPASSLGRVGRYPFGKLKVGQSFVVSLAKASRNSVSASAVGYGKRHGKKFQTAKEKGGVRVWRIE